MPFTVRFSGTEHGDAILGTVRYGHVWDWSAGRVKDSAFDSLCKLRLFQNYEFSNRLCRGDGKYARERNHYDLTHKPIIGQRTS